MGLSRLAQRMANDAALSTTALNPNAPVILPPAQASAGTPGVMPDWASALLSMNGCKAKWVINYWRIENRWGVVAHVSRFDNYDEWASVLKSVAERKA